MLNAEAKYRAQVAVQIVYFAGRPDAPRSDSWFWARAAAFTSNYRTAEPTSRALGDIVQGITTPTFGAHMAAQLETWRKSDPEEWRFSGLGGIPKPRYIDLGPDTVDGLPVLGGGGAFGPPS